MSYHNIFLKLIISLAIGILIGLEREFAIEKRNKRIAAGIRTFGLMGMVGFAAGFIADQLASPLPYAVIILIGGGLLGVNFFRESREGGIGLTTEFAALMTMLSGTIIYLEQTALGIAIGVVTMTLLSLKLELHQFVEKLEKADIYATIKFALISAIILPILPNQNFGPEPLNVFNPYKIWLLVVFISGISFVGYVLTKLVGAERGVGLTGILGGLASSTAVTLTLTQRSRQAQSLGKTFAQAILLAWAVMYIRMLIIVGAVNPDLIKLLWPAVAAASLAGVIYVFLVYRFQNRDKSKHEVSLSNPFELGPAIKFGLIFTIVLVVSKAAKVYLGDAGIYLASVVSGLADVDAISLSVSELSLSNNSEGIALETAHKAILIAAAANTFAKGMIASIGGSATMRRAIIPGTFLMIAVTLLFVFI